MASLPIAVLLNDGPLLCCFNVAIKGWCAPCAFMCCLKTILSVQGCYMNLKHCF